MPAHYIRRFDLSKYTLKSFDSANEICADSNASDQLTYNANGTTKVLVDTTSVQTLTNKTLSGATFTTDTIADPTDPTKTIVFDLASATASTALTLKDQQTTSQTLSVPNLTGADTIVTTGLAQSVTGQKTFTAPILGAATATTINKVTITAPTTSATITIPDGVTVTGPAASDTLVGRASTDTLLNKTLTTPTISNPTVSTGTFTSPALVTPAIGVATGTSLAVTAALTSSGPTGGGIGYATGAGGTITQITSRTTGVVLSKLTGTIQTDTTSLAAETAAAFTVTNTTVAIGDVVVVAIQGGTNGGNTAVNVTAVANGSFQLKVSNNNAAAGTAETGAIIINFAVIKAVSA